MLWVQAEMLPCTFALKSEGEDYILQVGSLPALKHLKLRGYMLTELAHLPASLETLDLQECKVTYEDEVVLPGHLTLKQLALPQWGGRFSWMKAFPIPGL